MYACSRNNSPVHTKLAPKLSGRVVAYIVHPIVNETKEEVS